MSDIQYDLEGLRANLVRCDANVETFEAAIAKEHTTKKELRMMIRVLEEKQARDDPR